MAIAATNPPRKIYTYSAPAGTNPFLYLDDKGTDPKISSLTTLDGIACNDAEGWHITGAWTMGNDADLWPYPNGVVTDDFDNGGQHVSIACMRQV